MRTRQRHAQGAIGRAALCCVLFLLCSEAPAVAQGWSFWDGDTSSRSESGYERSPLRHERSRSKLESDRRARSAGSVQDGGPRPVVASKAPPIVTFAQSFPINSIVIDSSRRKLYFVLEEKRAYEYSVSVGREGFSWTGTETVSNKQVWPDWYPPPEMRARD